MGTARRIAERFRAQLDELVMAEEALRAQDPNVQDGGPGWDAALAEFTKMVEEAFGDEMPNRPPQAKGKSSAFCKWCSRSGWCYGPLAGVEFDS